MNERKQTCSKVVPLPGDLFVNPSPTQMRVSKPLLHQFHFAVYLLLLGKCYLICGFNLLLGTIDTLNP